MFTTMSRKRKGSEPSFCPPCPLCESENVIPAKVWGPKLKCVDCDNVWVDYFYDDWDDESEDTEDASFL